MNPHQLHVWRFGEADGREGGVETVAVAGIVEGEHRAGGVAAGEAVDAGDLGVHLFDAAAAAELADADAAGVAVGGFGQVADDDAFDLGPFVLSRGVIVELAADDIGIHTRAADVLADLVEKKNVGPFEREAGNPLFGEYEKFFFAILHFLWGDGLDLGRFVVGVFDNTQAGDDAALGEHFAGDAANDLAEAVVHDRPVIDFCPFVLAQADEHHLHEARFDVADEAGMWLDAADNENVVSTVGVLVEMDRETFGGLADDDGFHAGADGTAAIGFGDAVAFDEALLPFGRAATVAAHRGDDEWLGP